LFSSSSWSIILAVPPEPPSFLGETDDFLVDEIYLTSSIYFAFYGEE
jgi:hypothetical protein